MSEIMFADGLISDEELEHFGIPKRSGRYPWGSGDNPYHHGASAPGGRASRKIDKMARKDAKRWADAKMYYGEGAGNRRKLLKAELSNKFKNEEYKKAFDRYLEGADYEKSAKKAKRERHTRDTIKTSRTTLHKVEKVMGISLVGAAAAYYVSNPEKVNTFIKNVADVPISYYKDKRNRKKTADFLRRAGVDVH